MEVGPRGIFKTPANTEIDPIEIAQQQRLLAEARFQLQRHQQFIPFALERVTFSHFIGIQAAGQLLGEGAAALQHLAASDVDEQGTGDADGIHPWVPPETGVFAGEQCCPQ